MAELEYVTGEKQKNRAQKLELSEFSDFPQNISSLLRRIKSSIAFADLREMVLYFRKQERAAKSCLERANRTDAAEKQMRDMHHQITQLKARIAELESR